MTISRTKRIRPRAPGRKVQGGWPRPGRGRRRCCGTRQDVRAGRAVPVRSARPGPKSADTHRKQVHPETQERNMADLINWNNGRLVTINPRRLQLCASEARASTSPSHQRPDQHATPG